jgi:hypothetical protein
VPEDRVTLPRPPRRDGERPPDASTAADSSATPTPSSDRTAEQPKAPGPDKLTADQQLMLEELRQRDRDVRAHEAAHQAAGGSLTSGASFSYQTGPDGRAYAIGGEVGISLSTGRTPDETIAIARQIRAAALAPADPSGQDLRVASEAAALELQATTQKQQLATQELKNNATESRGTHLHAGEPCAACLKATEQYTAAAGA